MTKQTYSFEEAAQYLNTSESTLSKLLVSGAIPAAKIGMQWVIRAENLEKYLSLEVERQTLERLECASRGVKPKVETAHRRNLKPDLTRYAA